MTDDPTPAERDRRSLARRTFSRSQFLGFLAGGALAGVGGRWALGLLGGWRFNTVEDRIPEFDPRTYRLTVDGLVARPFTLSYDELRALPAVRQVSDFHCVEGWGVDDVQWDGVRLQAIIDRAAPTEDAKFLTFHSMGGIYRDSLSMAQANFADTLIAYDMDGSPLSRPHGLPLRLVMPQMYGYKGPKWLTRIEFRPRRDFGFWEQRNWAVNAWIKR